MKRYLIGSTAILLLTCTIATLARAASVQAYTNREGNRIEQEAKRISSQADLMRSESRRLKKEAAELRQRADFLDGLWSVANQAAPLKFPDFAGRDQSQQKMRSDADRESRDSASLIDEGVRLDAEAKRLRDLAVAVNAEAEREWSNRFCCKKSDLRPLRLKIIQMARSLGLNYTPSHP
ncbi:hypothetical protein [Bradyrhizobium sp. HKCCYLS20291]|uniref:hypothetical protein n=1 Tax=Bradyrhizobium sp. HKCCYLS20291 TaxID=3420766 RepID=UPI003EBEFD25